jgi:hypothetical protein
MFGWLALLPDLSEQFVGLFVGFLIQKSILMSKLSDCTTLTAPSTGQLAGTSSPSLSMANSRRNAVCEVAPPATCLRPIDVTWPRPTLHREAHTVAGCKHIATIMTEPQMPD